MMSPFVIVSAILVLVMADNNNLLKFSVEGPALHPPWMVINVKSGLTFPRFNVTSVALCRVSRFHGIPLQYTRTFPLPAGASLSCTNDARFFEPILIFNAMDDTNQADVRFFYPGLALPDAQSEGPSDDLLTTPVSLAFDISLVASRILPNARYVLEVQVNITNTVSSIPRQYIEVLRRLRRAAFFLTLQDITVRPCPLWSGLYDCGSGACTTRLRDDAQNCGRCGRTCNSNRFCQGGRCVKCGHMSKRCNPTVNQCINLLTNTSHCGECGQACAGAIQGDLLCINGTCVDYGCNSRLPNVVSSVITATGCTQLVCQAGYANCDGSYINGCETHLLSNATCGACSGQSTRCSSTTQTCAGQPPTCVCLPGLGSCGGASAPPCSFNLLQNVSHCGSCGNSCIQTVQGYLAQDPARLSRVVSSCTSGNCQFACSQGYATCGSGANYADLCATSTASDVANCGSCGNVCLPRPNTVASCLSSTCTYTCQQGFADCDGNPSNGCEVNLQTSKTHCGNCSTNCAATPSRSFHNETYICTSGVCTLESCNSDRIRDCNSATATDGCEVDTYTDRANCGACGFACPPDSISTTYSCNLGQCTATCQAEYADCNSSPADGCEVHLTTSLGNCGVCDSLCSTSSPSTSTAQCTAGQCVVSCLSGYSTCAGSNNTAPCVVNLNTSVEHCGACAQSCSDPDDGMTTTRAQCIDGQCQRVECLAGLANCMAIPLSSTSDMNILSYGCPVNTSTDLDNCGACGYNCASELGPTVTDVSCIGGVCVAGACQSGRGDCDLNLQNGCEVDLLGDPLHCGTCLLNCSRTEAAERVDVRPRCSGASGFCLCRSGLFAECDGNPATICETNIQNNTTSCGACGNACGPNTICQNGQCVCQYGWSDCDANLANGCEQDVSGNTNCGQCGRVCATVLSTPGATCVEGTQGSGFQCQCPGALVECLGSTCIDLSSHMQHCGACGASCTGVNRACVNGQCICSSGYGNCTTSTPRDCSTDTFMTKNHCGACNSQCGTDSICMGGACSTCADPQSRFRDCNGDASDGCEQNVFSPGGLYCGDCGLACSINEVCDDGTCVCLPNYGNCTANPAERCLSDFTSIRTCGDCNTMCQLVPNAVASCMYNASLGRRTCAYSCAVGYIDCNDNILLDGCEIHIDPVDPCLSTPCQHGSVCMSAPAGSCVAAYTCLCSGGFTGAQCNQDVNECSTTNGGCAATATCSNTAGSRTCSCNTGYTGSGTACTDVNECITSNGGCDVAATCTNTGGSRTCACNSGFRDVPSGCDDINECETSNGLCDVLRACINTPGAYYCGDCPVGYTNRTQLACADIDECAAPDNAGCKFNCVNSPGSFTCDPVDPCLSSPCLNDAVCMSEMIDPAFAAYTCLCSGGFTGAQCQVDVNECATSNGACDTHSVCRNTNGSRTCGDCPSGFTGTGLAGCIDVNECAAGNGGCDTLTECTNTVGNRTCANCPATGYTGSGYTSCVDVDECATDNGGCDTYTVCENTYGSRNCSACPMGFSGSGATSCVDVNECDSNNGGCSTYTTCTNSAGSFNCSGCPSGYVSEGVNACVDINECATTIGGCDSLTDCINTEGNRTCSACPAGFSGTGERACVDINECETTWGGCAILTACVNTQGNRTCGACPSGYTGNGYTGCTNVNECATGNGGCDTHTTCVDSAGSFSCGNCPSGFTGSGSTGCVDVNECATGNGGCDTRTACTNVNGTNTCADCPAPAFTGNGNATCVDVNECEASNGGCDTRTECSNIVGGKICGNCPVGYTGNGEVPCVNVNECATGNGGCDALSPCVDTVGNYTCGICQSGYNGDGYTGCVDVNECEALNGGCDTRTNCTNTQGSLECGICHSGFTGDGYTSCIDINECAVSNGGCDTRTNCTNNIGAFSCGNCPEGFVTNGTVCDDINECATNNGGCDTRTICENTNGGFTCGACPASGFTGDGYNGCMDINECLTDFGGCNSLTVCINNDGNRTCSDCPPGYTGSGYTDCTDVNECATNNGECGAFRECTNLIGSRACGGCLPGYGALNQVCVYDTCQSNPCKNGGTCSNLAEGRYECTCPQGYYGAVCQTVVDSCASTPCSNGGSCANSAVGFACMCSSGFFGTHCQTAYDSCASLPCSNGATCTSSPSAGFSCLCATGYYGNSCQTVVDSCASLPCTNGATCANDALGYDCACPTGYNGNNCQSLVDSCASSPCENGGSCASSPTGYTCACPAQFTDARCQVDVNECSSSNGGCSSLSNCTNTFGNRTCGACPAGYEGSGVNCTDIDECASSNRPCDALVTCENLPGTFECGICPLGYNGTGTTSCQDINECATNNGECSVLTTCHNINGTFSCGDCPSGYTDLGLLCEDINECETMANGGCDTHVGCENTPGSRNCSACPAGFSGSGATGCFDVNECETANGGCDTRAACTNTIGNRTCGECRPGFSGSGLTSCVDIDECASNPCQNGATCINLVNSYACLCAINYAGQICQTEYDACASSPCQNGATCVSSASGHACQCPSGFIGVVCQSVYDSCSSSPCANGGTCANSPSGFVCSCTIAFSGGVCSVDVNECATSNGGCAFGATCSYTGTGSRTCACSSGFIGDGLSCVDINECATNNGGCSNQTCLNMQGSRQCTICPMGRIEDGSECVVQTPFGCAQSRPRCVDFNECETNNGGCLSSKTCINTAGSYVCCNPGAALGCDGQCVDNCTDICLDPSAGCYFYPTQLGCQLICTVGTGVFLPFINECAINNGGCSVNAVCTRPAPYTTNPFTSQNGVYGVCTCSAGYTGDGITCTDINECATTNGGCNANAQCTNTAGLQTCVCNSGFVGDGFVCTDVNECATTNGGCAATATCSNTAGSRTCSCNTGYTGSGTACTDVNECATTNGGCDTRTICENTNGGFACGACPASGFTGDGYMGCMDINECATNNGECGAFRACANLVGSRACGGCLPGYAANSLFACVPTCSVVTCDTHQYCFDSDAGAQCNQDVNECASNNGGCNIERQCINTPGSRICGACVDGKLIDESVPDTCITYDECAELSPWAFVIGVNLNGFPACMCGPYSVLSYDQFGGVFCNCGVATQTYTETRQECFAFPDPCTKGADDFSKCVGTSSPTTRCVPSGETHTCACPYGYSGDNCDACQPGFERLQSNNYQCKPIVDACRIDLPCKNGAACYNNPYGSWTNTTCRCAAGFFGGQCNSTIDACASNPCTNPRVCVNGNYNSFECQCAVGYYGEQCELAYDACTPSPCMHGGVCSVSASGYTCACPTGYFGTHCQTLFNSCSSSPCTNGGTCTNTAAGFTCACPTGYFGTRCQTTFNSCASLPCANGGTCANSPSGFVCSCTIAFSGGVCSVDVNECATTNGGCAETATCSNTVGSRTCACNSGYTGTGLVCTDVNECATTNGACDTRTSCTNSMGSRSCSACPTGFSGTGATGCFDTNECESNNGGCATGRNCTANAFPAAPTCGNCTAGYTYVGTGGANFVCVDINECAVNNGGCEFGTCVNFAPLYNCSCPTGFVYSPSVGKCLDVNECAISNGGCGSRRCANTIGSRFCECPPGKSGPSCTTALTDTCAYFRVATTAGNVGQVTTGANQFPGVRRDAALVAMNGLLWGGFGRAVVPLYVDWFSFNTTTNAWTFRSGSTISAYAGDYITTGTSQTWQTYQVGRYPAARRNGYAFAFNNELYYYAGQDNVRVYADMWKYRPSTNEWYWLSGLDHLQASSVQSGIGVFSAAAIPRARTQPGGAVFGDLLYVFGGAGIPISLRFHDLWAFNLTLAQWAFLGGAASNNIQSDTWPPSRFSSYMTATGTSLILLGGLSEAVSNGTSAMINNDMWTYSTVTGTWLKLRNAGINSTYTGLPASPVLWANDTNNAPAGRVGAILVRDDEYALTIMAAGSSFCDDIWIYHERENIWVFVKGTTPLTKNGVLQNSIPAGTWNETARFAGRNYPAGAFMAGSLWIWGGQSGNPGTDYMTDIWQIPLRGGCEQIAASECFCYNGGNCTVAQLTTNMGASYRYNCTCPAAFTGPRCEIEVCASSPCANGGTCASSASGFTCACLPGYFGTRCESLFNSCSSSPCSNGGTCSSSASGFVCSCTIAFSGGVCSVDVNECATTNGGCAATATCSNTAGSRTCACNTGYTGTGLVCTDVNECATTNGGCAATATCTNTGGSRTCACNSGYTGDGITCTEVEIS